MKVCVLIPVYNAEAAIGPLVSDVARRVDRCFVIDDGSTDRTAEYARQAGGEIIHHSKNRGKGASLRSGFDRALKEGYDAVITMDGDGQHRPEDISKFVDKAEKSDASIIIGDRMRNPRGMPLVRRLTNRFMSWMISRVCGENIPDSQCGFRLIKRRVLEKLDLSTKRFEIESEILIKAIRSNFKIDSIPIATVYRDEESRIRPIRDTIRFIRFLLKP